MTNLKVALTDHQGNNSGTEKSLDLQIIKEGSARRKPLKSHAPPSFLPAQPGPRPRNLSSALVLRTGAHYTLTGSTF